MHYILYVIHNNKHIKGALVEDMEMVVVMEGVMEVVVLVMEEMVEMEAVVVVVQAVANQVMLEDMPNQQILDGWEL